MVAATVAGMVTCIVSANRAYERTVSYGPDAAVVLQPVAGSFVEEMAKACQGPGTEVEQQRHLKKVSQNNQSGSGATARDLQMLALGS